MNYTLYIMHYFMSFCHHSTLGTFFA